MKTTFLVGSLAVALLAGGLTVLYTHAADTSNSDTSTTDTQRPRHGGKLLARAKSTLGITDEQAAQIKAQFKSEKKNITSLLTRLHDSRIDLRNAIQSADASEATVRAASAKLATVESDMAVERLKLHSKIAPLLTSDQQKKLQDMEASADQFVDLVINRIGRRLAE